MTIARMEQEKRQREALEKKDGELAERDREIADSNPFPDRPFLFAATAKRQFWTWGAECDLDYADFA